MKTQIEYLTKEVDMLGRCRFALTWITKAGVNRSQVFFANPISYGHKPPVIEYKKESK